MLHGAVSDWYKTESDLSLQMQLLSLAEQAEPSVVVGATMASDISLLRSYLREHPHHVCVCVCVVRMHNVYYTLFDSV